MMLNRLKALNLLSECTGDDIWSIEHCKLRGVPSVWIEELSDCFESGFQDDSQTIYVGDMLVNHYQGIRGVDLALRLADYLGIETQGMCGQYLSRSALVHALQQAAQEG